MIYQCIVFLECLNNCQQKPCGKAVLYISSTAFYIVEIIDVFLIHSRMVSAVSESVFFFFFLTNYQFNSSGYIDFFLIICCIFPRKIICLFLADY